MQLTVVVENFCQKQGLLAEWGYAVLLDTPEARVLLDTGGYCHTLTHNFKVLGIAPYSIDHIVLSHGHFDHTSGLIDVMRLNPQARVWAASAVGIEKRCDADQKRNGGGGACIKAACTDFIENYAHITEAITAFTVPLKARDPRFMNIKDMWQIMPDGQLGPDLFEDDLSLLVKSELGYSLVLGCAHAGLPNIMRHVQETFGVNEFHTVIGGTHLCAATDDTLPIWLEALKAFGVKHWRPNHCTGFKAACEIAKVFEDVQWAGCGTKLII